MNNEILARIGFGLFIAAWVVVGSWAAFSLTAHAQDLGAGELRPIDPGAYKPDNGGPRMVGSLALNTSTLTATSATTQKYVSAVRLTCSAACFVSVSASNGASMANYISGSYLGAAGESIVYRSNGGDYVIGVGSATVYIQELTR